MAEWNESPDWPALEELNGGVEYTSSSPATPEVFNAIVNALTFLHSATPVGDADVIMSSNYTAFVSGTEVLRASYSIDGGNTWIKLNDTGVITVTCSQIRFKLEAFYNGVETLVVKCDEIPALNMAQSRFGMSRTSNVVLNAAQDITVLIYSY